jgi:hypothetical protein
VKITLAALTNLVQALAALGGRQVEACDGDRKVVLLKPYLFDEKGQARYAAVKNKAAAKVHLDSIETERAALVAKHGPEAHQVEADPAKLKAFRADLATFLDQEVEFAAHRIPIANLNIGLNQLDLGLIEALLPILDGEI